MRGGRNPFLRLYALLVYVVLFAPIVVLILFSFNDSRAQLRLARVHAATGTRSCSATREVLDALLVTLQVAVDLGGRDDDPRDAAGPGPGAAAAVAGPPGRPTR